MTPTELQDAVRKRPFEPFRLVQTDGTSYDVRHPEMLLVGLHSAAIGLSLDPAQTLYERLVTLDLRHVIRMEPLTQGAKSGNGQGS